MCINWSNITPHDKDEINVKKPPVDPRGDFARTMTTSDNKMV